MFLWSHKRLLLFLRELCYQFFSIYFMFDFLKKDKFKKGSVNRNSREVFPQEVLLDSLAQRKKFFGRKKFEVPLRSYVFYTFFLIFVIVTFLLAGKSFWLQIVRGDELSGAARGNYERIYYGPTDRGVIYDRNFRQLVFNSTSFDFVCYKKDLPAKEEEVDELLKEVLEIINLEKSIAEFKKEIEESDSERVLIKEGLSHEEVISLRSVAENLTGFYLKENIVRDYVSGPYFAHIIGYLRRAGRIDSSSPHSSLDYVGRVGLEKEYEDLLRGQKEEVVIKKNALSEELSRYKKSEAEPGKSLVLWVDSKLQEKASDVLGDTIDEFEAEGGVVVAMDPKTGGVLSLVSLPSFDNNMFSHEIDTEEWEKTRESANFPFWNRVVSGSYACGSTIKPLIAAAALTEGIVLPDDVINCKGEIKVENPWFPDKPFYYKDWTIHGPISLRRAIAESCNVYFYILGGGYRDFEGLGVQKIKKYLNLFGWGEKTGVDLPGERAGLIPDPEWKKNNFQEEESEIWVPGDTYNLSIGQGYLSVTPLQVVSSFSSLVNQGKLMKPRLVKEIVDENRNVMEKIEPEVARENFINEEYLEAIKEGMRGAVTSGTAVRLSTLPVEAGAKTGTAQTGRDEVYNNWVTVFAPYEDPEIVLTVMVEKVPGEEKTALVVAREVLGWYFGEEKEVRAETD